MKLLILTVFMFFTSNLLASDYLKPEQATAYLKSLDCEFAAFRVYTGQSVKSELGKLNNGQVMSIGLCAQSLKENNALAHKFCWLRSVNMVRGKYTAVKRRGNPWRVESTTCTKEAVLQILNHPIIKGEILNATYNSEWKVAVDKFNIESEFNKISKPKK